MTDKAEPSLSQAHGHSRCLLCGEDNPLSLKLSFERNPDGSVHTVFDTHEGLQGYSGILHGGVIAALLDSAMTHCLFHNDIRAVTADLHVRYAQAIACGSRLCLWARLVEVRPPLYRLRAEITVEKRLMAWGEGKFLLRQEQET